MPLHLVDNWLEEKRAAYLYQIIAGCEKNAEHQKLFIDLAQMAEKQAAIWVSQMAKANLTPPPFTPGYRTLFIAKLIRLFGTKYLRVLLAACKIRGMSIYRNQQLHTERTHASGDPEHKHLSLKNGSNIRAAVFGINDGLVSNACLILGVAGAHSSPHFIILSGIAGLLGGACSMGSGEYVSVRSQREMLEYQLALEKHELETYPEEEAAELACIYEARGLPREEAVKVANILIQDPDKALATLAREELGINPDDLVSEWGAAISSFISFVLGAAIPLIPFVCWHSKNNLFYSIGLSLLALFAIGASLSLFTQRNMWWSGMRTMLIGVAAGAVTYFVGTLLGVGVT